MTQKLRQEIEVYRIHGGVVISHMYTLCQGRQRLRESANRNFFIFLEKTINISLNL